MTQRHAGRYRAKHPSDTRIAPSVMEAVSRNLTDKKIPCHTAFDIAAQLVVPPAVVGVAIDMQEARIVACQLGLFGYGKRKKIVNDEAGIDQGVKAAVAAAAIGGRLPCKTAWEIAKRIEKTRLDVSKACESMGIKISECQLGAF